MSKNLHGWDFPHKILPQKVRESCPNQNRDKMRETVDMKKRQLNGVYCKIASGKEWQGGLLLPEPLGHGNLPWVYPG